jgi:TolB-like protein/class 3 adenylate cyclase/Tfp pilus assembly protein PilF
VLDTDTATVRLPSTASALRCYSLSTIWGAQKMSAKFKKEIELEIAHVLFIDTIGYSKLLIDEQRDLIDTLNHLVRDTGEFRSAEAAGKLIKIATGDGMVLVFYNRPEAPVECALQISRALKEHPELRLRMGVHSGPVSGVIDVNERANVAGAGINVARRVMDCGDAGHILLSQHVADDLEQYGRWRPHLHDLGECEAKHGARVHVFNFYTDELGNRELPEKFRQVAPSGSAKKSTSLKWVLIIGAGVLITAVSLSVFDRFRTIRLKSASAQAERGPSLPIPEKSIGILPFKNLSDEKENAYFADGVQDEILTDLARIADLKVISRTSVMQYRSKVARNLREIGQQLGVAHLVEGSVQRAGNRVRVNAQLLDARTDRQLWAQTYDRDLADVFAIQSEIAQTIADQLQAKLSPKEKAAIAEWPTKDLAAYDLYLRANGLIYERIPNSSRWRENLFKAVELLDQAVGRDPAFLLAYCQLAFAHDLIYFQDFDHTETRLALAETSVKAAIRLRPDVGETHLAQAIHFYWGYRNYSQTREELDKAQHALPNNAQIFQYLGLIDRRQDRWDEAIRNLERAVDLDPRNQDTLDDLLDTYVKLRRYEEAIAVAYRKVALLPRSFLRIFPVLIRVDADANIAPLRATLNTIEAEGPASAAEVASFSFGTALRERDPAAAARALENLPSEGYIKEADYVVPHAWHEGLLAKLRQDAPAAHAAFTAARTKIEKLVRAQPGNARPLNALALIDAELGDKEKAIREGRTACNMLPPAKDAINGVLLLSNLARIYALTGEKDLALKELDRVSKLPSGPHYGDLRLDPEWDSLRGDPRFEKIAASLAPKETAPTDAPRDEKK